MSTLACWTTTNHAPNCPLLLVSSRKGNVADGAVPPAAAAGCEASCAALAVSAAGCEAGCAALSVAAAGCTALLLAVTPFGPMALATTGGCVKALQMKAENEAASPSNPSKHFLFVKHSRTGGWFTRCVCRPSFNPKTCKLHRNDTDAHTHMTHRHDKL